MAKVTGYRHYVYVAKWTERVIRSANTPAQIECARKLLYNYENYINLKKEKYEKTETTRS